MDNPYVIIGQVLAYTLLGLYTYLRGRRTDIRVTETETATQKLENEKTGLRNDIVKLKAVNEDLREQLSKLSHIQRLYDTMHEAHKLLQADFTALKIEVDSLRTALETERTTRHSVELHNGELQKALAAAEIRAHDLEVANNELRQVAAMLKPLTDLVRDLTMKTQAEPTPDREPEGANVVPGETVTNE